MYKRQGSTGVGSFRYVSFTFVRLVKRLLAALPHLATLALQAAGALLLPLGTHSASTSVRASCIDEPAFLFPGFDDR